MEQTDSEIILTENQELVSGTDDMGRMVYLVVDKMTDRSSQQGGTDLIYNLVDHQGSYDQLGTSATLDTDSQLMSGQSASLSLDARGTVYQYTVPVSSMETYQLPLGQGTNNSISDKVRVERVEQLPANNLTQVISADMLNNNTTADIILASSEEPDLNDVSNIHVQAYPSHDYGSILSMPFIPSNGPTNSHTLSIPTSMEDAQLLHNFSADALESLQSLLDVDVDTTITTTTSTEELIDSALNHENYNNSLQADNDQMNARKTTQRPQSISSSANRGDVRRSKRLSALTTKNYNQMLNEAEFRQEIEERKIVNRTSLEMNRTSSEVKRTSSEIPELLNAEYMRQEDVSMVKKSVSQFQQDFSSYPVLCRCKHKEKGTDIPIEQIWLHKNQMYYLPQINILVISFEEYVGFLRQDKWYVSVGEITQRLIPNFRSEVESYLVKNVCDKQFLSLEEIEYLKQRRCVNQSMKSGTMISLDTLRVMCKFLASTKAFIQAPTTGLSNAAHGGIYKKLLGKNTRCSKCGGAVKNIEASDRYVLLDSPAEILYSRRIEQSSSSEGKSLQKSMFVGEVVIGNVFFKSFKLDELTYISLKEIVECQVFNLQVLQSRLVQLQYRPRPAPTAIDSHFSSESSDVNQTLWIDLMTLRCACCMSRQRSPTSDIEVLQQMFSRGQYTCSFDLEIIAFDDYDSVNNETVYTLDPHTYKITTRHNYNQSAHTGAGRKVQRALLNEEVKKKEAAKVLMKSKLSSGKTKGKSNKVTIKRTSPEKIVVEPSGDEEEAKSLKPGVYYFADKNSIVDFLKSKTVDDTLREDTECHLTSQKRSNVSALSKPLFRLKSAPDTAPHLIRSGVQSYADKQANNKTNAAPRRGFKRKLEELEALGANFNNELRHDYPPDVTYCDDRSKKENDVSSSVQHYQVIQTVPQHSLQHSHDTYEYSTSGHRDHGLVKSPEVQDKNVDSTAANNVEEEEAEYSHSCGGKLSLIAHPSSTVHSLQEFETQGTENRSEEFINNVDNDNYDYFSNNDFGEVEENFSNSNTDVNADILHSVPGNNRFSSPVKSNSVYGKKQDFSASSPASQPVCKEKLRSPHRKTEYHSSEFSSGQLSASNLDLSPVKLDKCDIMTPDEILRTDLLSPGSAGIFSTPCVSPVLDRKSNNAGNTHQIERLYSKCASLDTSTDADKSLHVLATVASDLETLDERSQSNSSDKNCLSVFKSGIPSEFDQEKSVGVGNKKTTKKESFVMFLRHLLDNVAIRQESPSKKCVAVKFKDVAKNYFPALWKESGQTKLKKLVKLLALRFPVSSVEDLA